MNTKFKLTDAFLEKYKRIKPPFGFNGLGELVFYRTYSRIKENGENEQWWETIRRVVEGTFNMQKRWIDSRQLGWNSMKAQLSAQEMYDRMFFMKFLPSGRGLWVMGSPITEEKKLYMALNSCAFVSTEFIKTDLAKPFCFQMDCSMLGVGVGFDTKGEGKIKIEKPHKEISTFIIEDSREGWVESVQKLIESYLLPTNTVEFDYSKIRPEGTPIKGFGGIASGSKPLEILHQDIRQILNKNAGSLITSTTIVDLMNAIGRCVVSGNVRRSAQIALGRHDDEEYLNLKNYKINSYRAEFGWTSNNSVIVPVGANYKQIVEKTKLNGEPGFFWIDNARAYSRMNNGPDNKDHRVAGSNPCAEQSLEHMELCNLVETFPTKHENLEDFLRTLKYAYLYAKTVTLGETHWPETNRVMLRNRRIGCSMSGIAQFITKHGLHTLKQWCEEGYKTIEYYDEVYSDWLAIPKSIKKTSIKPSGTISLLNGSTPGIHYPMAHYYIRRVRLAKTSSLIKPLKDAGYHIEICNEAPETTVVVEIPVAISKDIKTVDQLSIWEQLSLAAFLQKYWADNQVSCTVFVKKEELNQIEPALNFFQYQLKSISFLPVTEEKPYAQMPYEQISEAQYLKLVDKLKPLGFKHVKQEEAEFEKYCTNDVCTLK